MFSVKVVYQRSLPTLQAYANSIDNGVIWKQWGILIVLSVLVLPALYAYVWCFDFSVQQQDGACSPWRRKLSATSWSQSWTVLRRWTPPSRHFFLRLSSAFVHLTCELYIVTVCELFVVIACITHYDNMRGMCCDSM